MLVFHVKEMADARRMSIRELSRRVDYRFETVRNVYHNEYDKILRIPRELIERLCREFNCSVGELMTIEGDDYLDRLNEEKETAMN